MGLNLKLALVLCWLAGAAFAQKSPEALIKSFGKTITGFYDNRDWSDTARNAAARRQQVIFFPIWEHDEKIAGKWFYFGWYSPADKERALEEAFWRVYSENGILLIDWFGINPDEKQTMPWLSENPFGEVAASDVFHEERRFCTCSLLALDNGFHIKTTEKCDFQNTHNTAAQYQYMLIDFIFSDNKFTSGSQFYDINQRLILRHEHKFTLKRVSKAYKKF